LDQRLGVRVHVPVMQTIRILGMAIDDLLQLIDSEIKGHPIFGDLNYATLWMPLQAGLFVAVSKDGKCIDLHFLLDIDSRNAEAVESFKFATEQLPQIT
jgi:hypothetical protein